MLPPPATTIEASPAVQAVTEQLQAIYARAFAYGHHQATTDRARYETADGHTVDPTVAGDLAGCRAVTAHMAHTIGRHLPGAALIDRPEDNPAVIDSTWHHPATGLTLTIEWDYTANFADPEGLIIREVRR